MTSDVNLDVISYVLNIDRPTVDIRPMHQLVTQPARLV